jgi:hypothetical protein
LLVPPNTYTDEPRPHRNLLIAGLQLLVWLYVHPSAWRNYVLRIDPDLPPDFCLAELDREHWQNPHLRRLLWINFLIIPIWVAVALTLMLTGIAHAGAPAIADIITGAAVGFAASIIVSTSHSVALGMATGIIGGVIAGILGGAFGKSSIFGTVDLVALAGVSPDVLSNWSRSVGVGLAAGLGATMLPQITTSRHARYSFRRQIGGVVVGVLISVFIVVVATSLAIIAGWNDAIAFSLGGSENSLAISIAASRTFGLALSLAWGTAVWLRTQEWLLGLALAASYTLILTAAFLATGITMPSLVGSFFLGIVGGLSFPVLFIAPFVLARRLAGLSAGAVAGALGSSGIYAVALIAFAGYSVSPVLPLTIACMLAGLSFSWWRPYFMYPLQAAWNTILYYADTRRGVGQPSLLRWNAAFWDEHQQLRMQGLDLHLVLTAGRNPDEGEAAIEHLTNSRQRWAAQEARVELEARWLAGCTGIEEIGDANRHLASGELVGPAGSILRSLARHSRDVAAALNQATAYNQRLALRGVEIRLNHLLRELERSSNVYATRFSPVADKWCQLLSKRITLLKREAELSQEIDNPYVFGVPLTEQQEMFVGRTDISADMERLLQDRRRPPLLLYGQRRMGKTSLLHNLGRMLPSSIVLLYVDCQGIAGAVDYADLLYNLARQMIRSAERHRSLALPSLGLRELSASPFTAFIDWLDRLEELFAANGESMALLALDEFEALDTVVEKGRFDVEDVLRMLRHLIQHRQVFKVLLAGSHTLREFSQWANYLVNVHVVHVGYLTEEEVLQLVERPMKNFRLQYERDASQRVLSLTRGHPHLVPLEHGSFFFADIEQNQVREDGRVLLRHLASQGESAALSREALARDFPDCVDSAIDELMQRELIESTEDGYRFQVELIRRWFT